MSSMGRELAPLNTFAREGTRNFALLGKTLMLRSGSSVYYWLKLSALRM